jgi:alpha-mannosidase
MNAIAHSINQLRQLTQIDRIDHWQGQFGEQATLPQHWQAWDSLPLNAKRHIAWSKGRQVLWLVQRIDVPDMLCGYPLTGLTLRLGLRWWAEDAQIFVDGTRVQVGDLFECAMRLLLSESVRPGDSFLVAIRLVSPAHDDGALVSSICLYERSDAPHFDPSFVADELELLAYSLQMRSPDHAHPTEQQHALQSLIKTIDFSAFPDNPTAFDRSLDRLHQTLPQQFSLPVSKIHLLGHAHLDLAWLWPVADTWDAAERTFHSALNLQQDFPELIFCHSTPALFAWLEHHRSQLFAAIQQQVKAGRWEIVAGLWVEPDLNLISGESIVRQVLYGQRYVREKFGSVSTVAWLPDTFGFTWQLPQILKQGGIEFFVTQKLRWNDTTEFPYEMFQWQSPDGSRIFSYMSGPIGQDINPVQMATYACDWFAKTGVDRAFWLPGVGDRGGGPTRDMLEVARRWQHSALFPDLEFTPIAPYLQSLAQTASLPVWNDELYLEFHRGCYTTHADQKAANRRCERLLYQAELFASIAKLAADAPYPKVELETAWKQVLFNQFHDILPGSSIPEVYVDADRDWRDAERTGSQILETALAAIAASICLPPPPQPGALPIAVFNALNWQRSQVVSFPNPNPQKHWQVYNLAGTPVPTQLAADGSILFASSAVPGVGYRVFWLAEAAQTLTTALYSENSPENAQKNANLQDTIAKKRSPVKKDDFDPNLWQLENQYLRAIIDPVTGNLAHLFDKVNGREVLAKIGGNLLQTWEDDGQYWDAWNINPNYGDRPLSEVVMTSIQTLEWGEVRSVVRVIRQFRSSQFCQDYSLEWGSPLLKITTHADWQERHIFVKAAFPLNLRAEFATYEIACGAIARTTQPQTPTDRAKWEVPALHWADLTEADTYGVSLLNDSKYGYDAQPDCLRLSLLRGSTWPDPGADLGTHHFTYAIYPHAGTWQAAGTVRRGYELNQPLIVREIQQPDGRPDNKSLPPDLEVCNLSAENVILMAFKQSEDCADRWVLRCYECHGQTQQLQWSGHFNLGIASAALNLLEEASDSPIVDLQQQTLQIDPWKIISIHCGQFKTAIG